MFIKKEKRPAVANWMKWLKITWKSEKVNDEERKKTTWQIKKQKCATVDLLSEWRLFYESNFLSLSVASSHSSRMPFMRVHIFVQHWSIRVELLHRALRLQGPAIIYIHTYACTCLPMFCLQNGSSLMLNLFIGFSYIKCFNDDRCCSWCLCVFFFRWKNHLYITSFKWKIDWTQNPLHVRHKTLFNRSPLFFLFFNSLCLFFVHSCVCGMCTHPREKETQTHFFSLT